MGSADNLNFDCLELIFAHLVGNDLVTISYVSRSFLAAVLPQLYRTLSFHLGNGKRFPKVMTAFDSINLHPYLAVHVHHIDIRIAPPTIKSVLNPKFMISCKQALSRCNNLKSFTCIPNNMLPTLLPTLLNCKGVENIRLNATLTNEQGKLLSSLTNLKTLAFDGASWNVVDTLPKWTVDLAPTLTCLILSNVQELNETILKAALSSLPSLLSLHVVGCPKIEHTTVLSEACRISALESLSITAWDSRVVPTTISPLPHLRHLTIDTHMPPPVGAIAAAPAMPPIWEYVFSPTQSWSCHLESIILRVSDKIVLSNRLVKDLADAHSSSLKRLFLLGCELDFDGLQTVAYRCRQLEKLAMKIPAKDVLLFSEALARSKSLQTLHDVTEAHTIHGVQYHLNRSNVRLIMEAVPTLNKLVSYGRCWTPAKRSRWTNDIQLKLEKRKNSCPTYWFVSK